MPETICEVGCGAGEVLKQLQESMDNECVFWGYEISPQAFELCKRRANEKLHFKMADITQENDAFFDMILVLDVLEHLEDYFSFLRGINSKGQYKIFHIPLDLSVQTILRSNALIKRRELHAHIHYFTKEIALQVLKDVGYEVLDFCYTTPAIDLPVEGTGNEIRRKLMRLPRKLLFSLNADLAAHTLGGWSLIVLAQASHY